MSQGSAGSQANQTKKSQYDDENFVAMTQNQELASVLQGCKHLYSSSPPSPLNDQSAEYVVQTIKHFFDRFIVIQYSILNTLDDHILTDVKLKITGVESAYNLQLAKIISLD